MPFPLKPSKKRDDEDFEHFAEMIRPIFLRMRLTMLANYTFKGGIPKKLGDPGVPTIP